MIISKAPLRISFFGGGSDLPEWWNHGKGAVLSAAIDKYMYVVLNKTQHKYIKLMYSKFEQVTDPSEIQHDIIRNTIKNIDLSNSGIEIASFADIPTAGTGLGSSSTFTVALLSAMNKYNGIIDDPHTIAMKACHTEIVDCMSPIGYQDQFAATYGGLNYFEFTKDQVKVNKITIETNKLQNNLHLFYTGIQRSANDILKDQTKNIGNNIETMNKMVNQADLGLEYIVTGRYDDFGYMLHDAWKHKARLSENISNSYIDKIYTVGMNSGSYGGKILGAGGGGYILFYCPENKKETLIGNMNEMGLMNIPFSFSKTGVETFEH